MALNADERNYVKAIWTYEEIHAEEYGGDTLFRLIQSFPESRLYFPGCARPTNSPQTQAQEKKVVDARTEAVKHMDNTDGAQCDLLAYGKKIIDALTKVVNHLDNIDAAVCKLNVHDLRVPPEYFPLLAHNILVTIAVYLHDKLDCPTQQALGKFLEIVGHDLKSKYQSMHQE